MKNAVNHLEGFNESLAYYTASQSPYLQGVELKQMWQLTNYTGVKFRSNTSPMLVLSGQVPGEISNSANLAPYNDLSAPENRGILKTYTVNRLTLGRDPQYGPTGVSTYITWINSGSNGFGPSGSIRSSANLFVQGRFDTYVSHYAEQRDLGQSNSFDFSSAFEESDPVERNASVILQKNPEDVILSNDLIQAAGSLSSFDGVIEAMPIRGIVDRSQIEIPYVAKGIHSSLDISDEKRRSYIQDDKYDLRQFASTFAAAPFLDYVTEFGNASFMLDQPGAFSDAQENFSSFSDTSRLESLYVANSVDPEMRNLFLSGVVSGSVSYQTPDIDFFPTYNICAGHGFVNSQVNNYGYDSIAFGGLKR